MSFSLYVHIPFCTSKCSYCDFVSFKYNSSYAAEYLKALELEIRINSFKKTYQKQKVNTIFIGGGTPTVLDAKFMEQLFLILDKYFYLNELSEFTVEANPGTLSKQKLEILKGFGVNRLSIGVQAYQKKLLDILGRAHTYEQVVKSFEYAHEVGIKNINADLIFGIPTQLLSEWELSLKRTLELNPKHIACYSLQLENGTSLFERIKKKAIEKCSEELELAMYNIAIEILTDNGYMHYEISNFSKYNYQSKHNLCYWHNDDYMGIGLAAHSHLNGIRYSNTDNFSEYLHKLSNNTLPIIEQNILSKKEIMSETLFMGLRLIKGINLNEFYKKFGVHVTDVWPKQIKKLTKEGLVLITNQHLRLTEKGIPVANVVFREFV